MWVFSSDSFVSVVAHRERPGYLIVRARQPGDLESLIPGAFVDVTPSADYRFRTVIHSDDLAELMAEKVRAIRYDNFKNSVRNNERHDVYSRVWSILFDWQYRTVQRLSRKAKPRTGSFAD